MVSLTEEDNLEEEAPVCNLSGTGAVLWAKEWAGGLPKHVGWLHEGTGEGQVWSGRSQGEQPDILFSRLLGIETGTQADNQLPDGQGGREMGSTCMPSRALKVHSTVAGKDF